MTMTEERPAETAEGVSGEQHLAVYRKLLEEFERWRQDNSWCTELYTRHVARLSRVFNWEYDENAWGADGYGGHGGDRIRLWLDACHLAGDEDRKRDLDELRGRILAFTREMPDYINLDRANRFLTAAGLEPWGDTPVPEPARFSVELYGTASGVTEEEIRKRVASLTRRLGMPADSSSFSVRPVRQPRLSRVPESATVRLLSR